MTPEAERLSAEINATLGSEKDRVRALLSDSLPAEAVDRMLRPPVAWPTEQDAVMGNRGRARVYTTPDGVFPSVTTVLRVLGLSTEALVAWSAREERKAVLEAVGMCYAEGSHDGGPAGFVAAVESRIGQAKAHQKLVNKAADIGTATHQRVQWMLRQEIGQTVGPEPVIPDASLVGFMSFQDYWRGSGLRAVRSEQPVWSQEGYAGTVDIIAEHPTKGIGVIDIKTSRGIYDDFHLQVAAYCNAARGWADIRWAEIVRLPKSLDDPAFEVKPLGALYGGRVASEDDLMTAFRGALSAWNVLCV